jgi:hypothetical protein
MDIALETVMTAAYFDPQRLSLNTHGLIYLYFTHKPESLQFLKDKYDFLESFFNNKGLVRQVIALQPPQTTHNEEIDLLRREEIKLCQTWVTFVN